MIYLESLYVEFGFGGKLSKQNCVKMNQLLKKLEKTDVNALQ
jgi:hypothetical protein